MSQGNNNVVWLYSNEYFRGKYDVALIVEAARKNLRGANDLYKLPGCSALQLPDNINERDAFFKYLQSFGQGLSKVNKMARAIRCSSVPLTSDIAKAFITSALKLIESGEKINAPKVLRSINSLGRLSEKDIKNLSRRSMSVKVKKGVLSLIANTNIDSSVLKRISPGELKALLDLSLSRIVQALNKEYAVVCELKELRKLAEVPKIRQRC